MLPDSVLSIYGFLSAAEAELLYTLASAVPIGGTIVEIGSFQGKSAVCLGLGAKQVPGVQVYAIDPHVDCWDTKQVHYGMENHAALLMNLVLNDVADTVKVVALHSTAVLDCWYGAVDLVWIDGSHDYNDVWLDLMGWEKHITDSGKLVLHDTNGHYPGVTRALTEFLMENEWKISQRVDATAVLERG